MSRQRSSSGRGRGSTPAVCQVRHSTGRSCTCTSTCRDRERGIALRHPHHPPGHGSLPFNFCCCPNSTSSIDLTASSACFTIIKKSSCPENWQGDHPSGLRLHYAYALTPKMESTTSPLSPTTRHFDLHTLPFSARTAPSPGGDHYSITRSEDFHCRHHRQRQLLSSTSISMMSKQASKLVRNSTKVKHATAATQRTTLGSLLRFYRPLLAFCMCRQTDRWTDRLYCICADWNYSFYQGFGRQVVTICLVMDTYLRTRARARILHTR